MRRNKHKLTGGIGMGRRGFVLAPLSPLSSMRRPRAAPFAPLTSLPGLLALWDSAGAGTAGSYATNSANAALSGTVYQSDVPSALSGSQTKSINFTGSDYAQFAAATLPALSNAGVGYTRRGPRASFFCWVKWNGATSYRAICLGTATNGLYIGGVTNGRLNFYNGGDHSAPSGTLVSGTWAHVGITIDADGTHKLWKDGVVVHSWVSTSGYPLDLTDLGGTHLAAGTYTLGGNIAQAVWYDDVPTDAEILAMAGGTLPSRLEPIRKYTFDNTANDSSRSLVAGSAVTTLTDLSPNGNSPTQATAGKRPGYGENNVPWVNPAAPAGAIGLPLMGGMTSGLRFDGTDDTLAKSSPAGLASPVTAFSVFFAGRLWAPHISGTDKNVPVALFGAAKVGDYSATDAFLRLGYRYGRDQLGGVGAPEAAFTWEGSVQTVSGATKTVSGSWAHSFPLTLALVYDGGAGTLRIYENGVQAGVITGCPASLDLSGILSLCPGVTGMPNAGWQFRYGAVGSAAWSASTIAAFHTWAQANLGTFPSIATPAIYDGGPYDGSNATGFSLGASIFKTNSGRLLCAQSTMTSDPNDNSGVRLEKSDDGGATWSNVGLIHHDATPVATYILGNPFVQPVGISPAGRIRTWTSTAPAATQDNWKTYELHSDDDGDTWSAPALVTVSGMGAYLYSAPCGRVFDLGSGLLRMMAYAVYTATGKIHDLIWESADYGATWALRVDLVLAGGGNAAIHYEEGAISLLGGSGAARRWRVVHRDGSGQREWEHLTLDDMATWSTVIRMGAPLGSGSTMAQPFLTDPIGSTLYFIRTARSAGGTPAWSAGDSPGVVLFASTNEGASYGPPVAIAFGQIGHGYPTAVVVGTNLVVAYTDEISRLRGFIVPLSAIPTGAIA